MLGNHEIQFSPLIIGAMRLGLWGANFSLQELERFVEGCLDLGLKDFDHADIYGDYTTEAAFGELLVQKPGLRKQMQITTKCGIHQGSDRRPDIPNKAYESSARHIIQSVEKSLKNLSTDYIDVLLLHRPDYLMDPVEVAEAFQQLQTAGKVLAFGVSNFSSRQIALLSSAVPLLTHQLELSVYQLEGFMNGDLDYTFQLGIIPTAWSPFAGGKLFNPNGDAKAERLQVQLKSLCAKYNCSIDQLALAWLHTHPAGIIPVLGTTKLERVQSAMKGMNFKLDRFDWYAIWQASSGEVLA